MKLTILKDPVVLKTASVLGVFAILWASYLGLSHYVERRLLKLVTLNCAQCLIDIKSSQFSFINRTIKISGVHFATHPDRGTHIELYLKELYLDFLISAFFQPGKVPIIPHLKLNGIQITAMDDDKTPGLKTDFSKREALSQIFKKFPPLQIKEIQIENSHFVYQQKGVDGRTGELSFTQVQGAVSNFATRANNSPERVQVKLVALLEGSGQVRVSADWGLYGHEGVGQLVLEVDQLKIGELNRYFVPQYKARLSGHLNYFKTTLNVTEDLVKGELYTDYKDFKVHFLKTRTQGSTKTWIRNAINSISMSSIRNRSVGSQYKSAIYYKRERLDAFVHFLIRGVAPAIKKVVTS